MTGRKRKLSVSANGQTWRVIASEAAALTANAGTKERASLYADIANRHDIEVHVLRRLVAAVRTSERLGKENAPIVDVLANLPFAPVEVLLRWQEHDAEGAGIAARQYLERKATVRQLVIQERAARDKKQVVVGTQPRDMDRRIQRQALQRAARPHLAEIWSEAPEFKFIDVARPQDIEALGLSAEMAFAGIDVLAMPRADNRKPVAFEILVVDESIPFSVTRQRLYQQVWRSLGLTTQGLRAGIVVVAEADLGILEQWIKALGIGENLLWFQFAPSKFGHYTRP